MLPDRSVLIGEKLVENGKIKPELAGTPCSFLVISEAEPYFSKEILVNEQVPHVLLSLFTPAFRLVFWLE